MFSKFNLVESKGVPSNSKVKKLKKSSSTYQLSAQNNMNHNNK